MEVVGLPAQMRVGETVEVTVRWLNRSGKPWNPREKNGTEMRVEHRFVDRATGYRNRRDYDLLPAVTAPGAVGERVVRFTPRFAGRFRLTFGLLRVPRSGWSAPSATNIAAQRRFPGEVAQAVYAVEVTP